MLLTPAIAARPGSRPSRFSHERFWAQVREAGATINLLMPAQLSILMTASRRSDDRDHPLELIFEKLASDEMIERFCIAGTVADRGQLGRFDGYPDGPVLHMVPFRIEETRSAVPRRSSSSCSAWRSQTPT